MKSYIRIAMNWLTKGVHRFPRLRRAEYDKHLSMNLKEWLLYHQEKIHFDKTYWMGKRSLKNPIDAWMYQEIIYHVQPDIIIEIGSAEGGSTLFFAHMLDLLGYGQVISVDIDRSKYSVKHNRIFEITGDSSSDDVVTKVQNMSLNKIVLVIHDGGHEKEQVLKDLYAYSKFVSVGSYFIVEDGIVDLFPKETVLGWDHPGPLFAVEEFLKTNQNFKVDESCERYILTYNPRGFLKRIK